MPVGGQVGLSEILMTNVAIVGGGPSGLYALKALAASPEVDEIALFETGERWGLGTPYDPALNHPSLLANIASFELPPLVDTLVDWLSRLSPDERAALGVGEVSARAFYPRVALGAYFEAQHDKLVARFGARACARSGRRGLGDVRCGPEGVSILYASEGRALESATFDFVILATGHRSRPCAARDALTAPVYPPPAAPPHKPLRAAVLGASLTAIDATLAMALSRGDFTQAPEGVAYRWRDGAAPLKVTMLSRRGVLLEADFYFPYHYSPLQFRHAAALARALPQGGLDAAFGPLAQELATQDPAWAERVNLASLSADNFADAYFAGRNGDPFAQARRNLEEARRSGRAQRVSAYRYVILRAHEAFAEIAPHLTLPDRTRFRRGLQRVFVDNYAAVPPLSVERLLALHAAGALEVQKIAPAYRLEAASAGVAVVSGSASTTYDVVVDARGEGKAAPRELPFPMLRLQILANERLAGEDEPADLAVTDALGLEPGVNPVERVYCLAAPFLLSRRPFVQGLTCAHDLAERAVADLLRRAAVPARRGPRRRRALSGRWPRGDDRPSHLLIIGAAAAFRRRPGDVLRGVLDVAGFAMHAILRVDDEARIGLARLVAVDDLVNARRAIEPRRLGVARQVDAYGDRRVRQLQMNRLVLLVIGVGEEHRGRYVERDLPVGLGIDLRLDMVDRL
jgi:uncharacterized NAD(P)/FAD-binding protein YdhS